MYRTDNNCGRQVAVVDRGWAGRRWQIGSRRAVADGMQLGMNEMIPSMFFIL